MITIKALQAKTLLQKSIGLIRKKKIEPLFFKTRWGIHTFGMEEAIDVVILDKETVVALKENVKPNRIFLWNPKYYDVLELPKGSIKKLQVKLDSQVKIFLEDM